MAYDWSTQETTFANMLTMYDQAEFRRWTAESNWGSFDYYYSILEDDHTALYWLGESCRQLRYALGEFIAKDESYDPKYLIPYYFANFAGVTWEAICSAWIKNDFEGRQWTIAMIDHMRKLLWNEPFDVVFAATPSLPGEE